MDGRQGRTLGWSRRDLAVFHLDYCAVVWPINTWHGRIF